MCAEREIGRLPWSTRVPECECTNSGPGVHLRARFPDSVPMRTQSVRDRVERAPPRRSQAVGLASAARCDPTSRASAGRLPFPRDLHAARMSDRPNPFFTVRDAVVDRDRAHGVGILLEEPTWIAGQWRCCVRFPGGRARVFSERSLTRCRPPASTADEPVTFSVFGRSQEFSTRHLGGRCDEGRTQRIVWAKPRSSVARFRLRFQPARVQDSAHSLGRGI